MVPAVTLHVAQIQEAQPKAPVPLVIRQANQPGGNTVVLRVQLGSVAVAALAQPKCLTGLPNAQTPFLDHETAKIDTLIAEQQRLIELLNEKRQAVISHAVTKGLNPNAPMKPSGVEWLGDVPKHWVVGGLPRFIGPVVDYRGRTPEKLDSGMFLVTARNIRNGKIDYEASEEYVSPASAESLLARGRPEIGDLLFTMEAPLGSVAQIERAPPQSGVVRPRINATRQATHAPPVLVPGVRGAPLRRLSYSARG